MRPNRITILSIPPLLLALVTLPSCKNTSTPRSDAQAASQPAKTDENAADGQGQQRLERRTAVVKGVARRMLIAGRIRGQFTEFSIPKQGSFPQSIIKGPDGSIWFTQRDANKIGRFEVKPF